VSIDWREGERKLGRPRFGRDGNIKMDTKEMCWESCELQSCLTLGASGGVVSR
jgi:hypothetical protein